MTDTAMACLPATSATAAPPLVVGRVLGTVVVALSGEIDGCTSSFLGAVLTDLIEGQGNQAVVVDLADLRRLDRSATEVLATAAHTSSRRRGRLALSRPSADVAKVLAAAGLAELVVDRRQPDGTPLAGSLERGVPTAPPVSLDPVTTDPAPFSTHGGNS